jgi:hypothetical protein
VGFEFDAEPAPAPIPWILSGTKAQLEAWRAQAERDGFADPMRWVQRTLDAAAVPPERRYVVPVSAKAASIRAGFELPTGKETASEK